MDRLSALRHRSSSEPPDAGRSRRCPSIKPETPKRQVVPPESCRCGFLTARASTTTSVSPRRTVTRAQRSYSVASSPLDVGEIELTIDRLAEGEVSPYFHDVLVEGDMVEVRGPFASYFVWRGEHPALLVGGGSGVVPLMAMLRHRRRTMPELPMRLVYSVRNADDVIYADELGDDTSITFTREPPSGWKGHAGRIDAELLDGRRARGRGRPSSAARTGSSNPRPGCSSTPAGSRRRSVQSGSGPPAERSVRSWQPPATSRNRSDTSAPCYCMRCPGVSAALRKRTRLRGSGG